MDGPEKLDIAELRVQSFDRLADSSKRVAERFTPVCRDQHEPLRRIELNVDGNVAAGGREQRVDDRIPRDEDGSPLDSFANQVIACRGRRGEVDRAEMGRGDTIGFFRKWREQLPRTKPRLDVPERNSSL